MSETVHKIAVVGSRTYPVPTEVWLEMSLEDKAIASKLGRNAVEKFVGYMSPITNTLISGGARGVDTWAAEKANEMGMRVVEIRANWNKYGKGAGFKRNKEIVMAAHEVVAFWDGTSRGTLHTINTAHKLKIPYVMFNPAGEIAVAMTAEAYAEAS